MNIYIKGNVLNLRVLNERKYDSFGGGSQRLKPVFLICLFISCPFSSSQTCHKKSENSKRFPLGSVEEINIFGQIE